MRRTQRFGNRFGLFVGRDEEKCGRRIAAKYAARTLSRWAEDRETGFSIRQKQRARAFDGASATSVRGVRELRRIIGWLYEFLCRRANQQRAFSQESLCGISGNDGGNDAPPAASPLPADDLITASRLLDEHVGNARR